MSFFQKLIIYNVNDKNFPDILIFFINEVAKGS